MVQKVSIFTYVSAACMHVLWMCHAFFSPFNGNHGGGTSLRTQLNVSNQSNGASSNNSTPYSQISIPSSYDYEDDFTSESESEIDLLNQGIPDTVNNRWVDFSMHDEISGRFGMN